MKKQDREQFKQYLENCTDQQVLGVLEKERAAGRVGYTLLAEQEANRRNLEP